MKLFALIATASSSPVEGTCEPQQGWNCMYPHHKHGAVCFKSCSAGSSGKHEQNAYKECHCKSHNNCEWVELSHCKHPHTTQEPATQESVDTIASAIESMFDFGDFEDAEQQAEQPAEQEAEQPHKKHHGHHHSAEMANDAVPVDVLEVEEAEEEVEEVAEVEEVTTTTAEPTTTTASLTNCQKPHHHWDCDAKEYVAGTSCKRECFKGAGYGLGENRERHQTCNCNENGCFWLVTSDCSHFHNQVYKAELATFNAKNQKSCERKNADWNCSHDYIHTQGTLCVRECDASFGLSDDFHAVSECQCHHDDCNWAELSSCQ